MPGNGSHNPSGGAGASGASKGATSHSVSKANGDHGRRDAEEVASQHSSLYYSKFISTKPQTQTKVRPANPVSAGKQIQIIRSKGEDFELDQKLVNYPAFLRWEDAKKSRSNAGHQIKTDHGVRSCQNAVLANKGAIPRG